MKPVITPLIEIQQQLQIFHWQTKSYAEHKAFGKTYEDFGDLMDNYVESLFGRTDRIYGKDEFTITLKNYSEANITEFINRTINYLENDLPVSVQDETYTELGNIRDEMLALFSKLKYLLTLK